MQDLKIYKYDVSSATDIPTIVGDISSLNHKYILIYIYAYLHNTVISQTLKRELEKVSNVKIFFLKNEQRKGAKLTVFGYDKEPYEDNLLPEIMGILEEELFTCKDSFKNSKEELIKKYFNDQLTNLPNIYKLRKDLESFEEVSIVSITIDDFKAINSFYGFFVGDFILEKIAGILKEQKEFEVYKMPGGEFVLLLEKFYNYYELLDYIKKLYEDLVSKCIVYNKLEICLDFTITAVTSKTIEKLLSKISLAFEYAKQNKLPFFIYEDKLEIISDYKQNIELSLNIRQAIRNDRVVAFYQPIIDNTTKKIVKFEALARLVDEDNEVQSPDKFLEIAKKTKIYTLITKKIITSAFETFKSNDYEISINISKEDIVNEEIYTFIIEKLSQNPNIARRVVFEFLESDISSFEQKSINFINEVKRYGAKIAIDDFGSGYSNFSLLINMRVDYIKIDGELISKIDINRNSFLVVESIVEFAKKLGMKVIAEHVYSSSILAKVKELGIEFSQGFYIDKPRVDIAQTNF